MWRHLYTWSSSGSLGAAGWQTVAASRGMTDADRQALEALASRLRTVEVARPDAPAERRRRFVTDHPSRVDRTVLTRVEPLGSTGDGRPGNAWIESVVVPHNWLEAAGWDVAAAFEAVGFLGPERGDRRVGMDLDDEALPPLRARSTDRAGRLSELVPDLEIRRALLEALVRQARLEGETGHSEPIHVVEAPGAAPGELEELIQLLPLVLPPEDRERGAGDHRRGLRLGTYAPPGDLPDLDLLGVPERYLEDARGGRGRLIDLGGAISPPRSDDPADSRAADTIERSLAEPSDPLSPPGAAMSDRPPSSTSVPPLGDPADLTDPLAERGVRWQAREAAEGEAGTLLHDFRQDLDELLAPVRQQVETIRKSADERSAGLARDFDQELEKERRLIDQYKDKALRELADEAEAVRGQIQRELSAARQEVERLRDDAVDAIREDGTRSQRNLKAAAAGEEIEEFPARSKDRPKKAPAPGGRSRPSTWDRLRESKPALGVAIGLLVVVLLGAGWWLWKRGDDGGVAESPETPTTMQPERPGQPLTRLTDRLADPAEAAQFLGEAARSEALRDRAAATYLRIAQGPGRAFSAQVSCALLQTTLGVGVDGDCGGGTQSALAARVVEGPCAVNGWEAQGACVLDEAVSDEGRTEPCDPSWPFERTCSWRPTEAQRLLDLVRKAAAAGPRSPVELDGFDLAENGLLAGRLDEVESVPRDVAQDLAFLAYRAERLSVGRTADAERRPETLDAEQVDRVEAYLDRLRGTPATGSEAPAT